MTIVGHVVKEHLAWRDQIGRLAITDIRKTYSGAALGWAWAIIKPTITIFIYWFAFSSGLRGRAGIDGYPFFLWMLAGIIPWFYISEMLHQGTDAMRRYKHLITKMKFPVSVLPATVVFTKLFDHFCLMIILTVLLAFGGYYPSLHWLGLVYYCFCAIVFGISLSLTTSVLNMLARDMRKLVLALMRLLLYMTPILWNIKTLPGYLQRIMLTNPIYYIVQGYRDCFFYHKGFMFYKYSMVTFWVITIFLFVFGSTMMYKFKAKFVDFI